MRAGAVAWLLLLCPLAGAQSAAPSADEVARELVRCVDALPATLKPGIEPLREHCPQIQQQLEQLGLDAQLEPDWQRRITREGLDDVLQLRARYTHPLPTAAPNVSALPQILRAIRSQQAPDASWWQRLKQRILSWLHLSSAARHSWLEKLVSRFHVPPWLQRVVFITVLAALLVSASWVLWREFKPRQRRAHVARGASGPALLFPDASARALSLEDVERAAALQRPALLLRLLVQVAVASGRLRAERCLTHQELAQRTRFDDDAQRAQFAGLARLAERQLYGAAALSPAMVERALADGVQLSAQLQVAAAGPP